ncbi:hypothetical protein AB0300_18305 [Microbacterium sp. NPDC078814]|uniref:phage tail tube protein n=1 Tax=Microbacterium sp. NPDC078814 TaxID=3154767 RepID=UPI00344D84CD
MNEPVQKGTASDGHGIVVWLPGYEGGAPTVADMNNVANKRVTYGLTGDGFDLAVTINSITSTRYTLAQALKLEGTKDYTLTTRYVYNREEPTDAELVLGAKGTKGAFAQVLGYPNDHVFAAGDIINAIIPVRIGTSTDVPPTANTELAKQMIPEITGEVLTEVAIVA